MFYEDGAGSVSEYLTARQRVRHWKNIAAKRSRQQRSAARKPFGTLEALLANSQIFDLEEGRIRRTLLLAAVAVGELGQTGHLSMILKLNGAS